ncbi:MAG: SDR family oxidoreductase [Ruminococcus sp.]|nr:SDR family oxidoreductase [Ruminococcus sp.]MCR5141353.1 SDR family oxidoreductase [Ruminococcus sp.]
MEKWVLVTGASSGIGEELAKLYAKRGYSIALAARRADRLYDLAMKLETDTRVIPCDLSERQACYDLYDAVADLNVEMLINCAGFGAVGRFDTIDLERQIEMTDVNCTAVMILTYLFLKEFRYRDCGTILNVASSAGLMPGGPNMAVYYASKAYVVSLTNAIYEELKLAGSNVKIAALCPGPVDTEFNKVADVKFSLKGITPQYCAKCAAWGLDRGKRIIIPEEIMQLASRAAKVLPDRLSLRITAHQQKKKI